MKGSPYEQLVARLLAELESFSGWTIHTNKKYRGRRQPGEYEIDVSLEKTIGHVASFLLIVECKNWGKPVDRPVVQKFAQTRDAIAAHKAAIVSPRGCTREAVKVARAHGMALWVLAADAQGSKDMSPQLNAVAVPLTILIFAAIGHLVQLKIRSAWKSAFGESSRQQRRVLFRNLRSGFLSCIRLTAASPCRQSLLLDFTTIGMTKNYESLRCPHVMYLPSDVYYGSDHSLAVSQIIDAFAEYHVAMWHFKETSHKCAVCRWREQVQGRLLAAGLPQERADSAIEAVLKDDAASFLKNTRRITLPHRSRD